MQVATDESYRDPTNLSGKLQKHQAFEAELTANKDRVEGVCMVSAVWCLYGDWWVEGVCMVNGVWKVFV